MLRKLLLSISLALLLAIGQQGALVHEISHYADIGDSTSSLKLGLSSSHPDKAPHSPLCDKCLGYGELAHTLTITYVLPPIVKTGFTTAFYTSKNHDSRRLSPYSARAPPKLA